MARLGRYFLHDQPLHVIQRGNDRQAVFFSPDDYARYRDWLIEASGDYGLAVHAYVLMTNHVHLLVTPSTAESLPRTMQSLGRRYVRLTSILRTSAPARCGRGGIAPRRSTAMLISSLAAAISSSIRCVHGWRRIRATTSGRVFAPTPTASLKNVLGQIQADCCNFHNGWLLSLVVA